MHSKYFVGIIYFFDAAIKKMICNQKNHFGRTAEGATPKASDDEVVSAKSLILRCRFEIAI